VTFGRIDRGANANLYGDLEDWTDAQRAIVDRALDRIYDDFVARVSEARNMSPEAVDAIGRGRVFTGVQGLGNGLVDVVGGFDAALAEAKQLAAIAPEDEVQLVDFPSRCRGGSSWPRWGAARRRLQPTWWPRWSDGGAPATLAPGSGLDAAGVHRVGPRQAVRVLVPAPRPCFDGLLSA